MYQRQVLPDRPRLFRELVPPVVREAGDWLEAQVNRVDATLAGVRRLAYTRVVAARWSSTRRSESGRISAVERAALEAEGGEALGVRLALVKVLAQAIVESMGKSRVIKLPDKLVEPLGQPRSHGIHQGMDAA